MPPLATCRVEDSISTITMDDGKVNALSLPMITELNAALDQAASAGGVVLLGGRDGVFSAHTRLIAGRVVGRSPVRDGEGAVEAASTMAWKLPAADLGSPVESRRVGRVVRRDRR